MVLNRGNTSLNTRASMWCTPGHAVGGRRPLVEGPERPPAVCVQRPLEELAVPPAGEHLVLHGGQVDRCGQVGEVARAAWCRLCRAAGGAGAACPGAMVVVLRRGARGPDAARSRGFAGGTRRAGGGPAVPPSLAAAPARADATLSLCPAAGSTGLAGHAARAELLRLARCCSSGGSGVIWSAGLPPGSHHPRVAPGRPPRQLSPSTPLPTTTIADRPAPSRPVSPPAARARRVAWDAGPVGPPGVSAPGPRAAPRVVIDEVTRPPSAQVTP